jgi:hypothetical protein
LKELGFISKADTNFKGIYTILSLHPVVWKEKITSKVRHVFNGSAKLKSGFIANDCLEEGHNLNPDILYVILSFWLNPVAWTADIRKEFFVVNLLNEDVEAFRFYTRRRKRPRITSDLQTKKTTI